MRKPVIEVIGETGADLLPGWGPALTRVSITDNEDGEADELEIEFAVSPPFPAPPAKGTQYKVRYGWEAGALRDGGVYTFQQAGLSLDPAGGWLMTIAARSADFVAEDKSAGSQHFAETTVGEIVKKVAGKAGKSAIVHPDIAKIEIPYRMRWMQSRVGFVQDLLSEFGGALKLNGGKYLAGKKGSGQTAGGATMPPVVIDLMQVIGGDLTSEGRPDAKTVSAGYLDIEDGLVKLAEAAGIGKAAAAFALHPARSKAEAEIRAKAEAADLARASIGGGITIAGSTTAMAGAPVKFIGFGGWAALDSVAATITHDFSFDEGGGWLMSVELAAKTK